MLRHVKKIPGHAYSAHRWLLRFLLREALETIGAIGVVAFVVVYAVTPSFPTPDKILVFATFAAMMFGQARELLKRFVPFVTLLLVYESFRGIADELNTRVNYNFMPAADRLMASGRLPTKILQNWWWQGRVMWYDFVFYGAYMLHFVLPFALAVYVWKTKAEQYWRLITAYLILSFAGFITYLAFPAAPPWMASDMAIIEPITRISSHIFYALGIQDFPSVYNKITPNPVAAVPSLHAAYAFLFAFIITRLYKSRWRLIAWIYPVLICVGTVYTGEHYVIDAVLGILYAVASYFAAPYLLLGIRKVYKRPSKQSHPVVK